MSFRICVFEIIFSVR